MKILLLAPHPFFQERGTPIAVRLLVEALHEHGHAVDILTYHEGEDPPALDGVRIFRIAPPPFVHGVKPGFSIRKVICDAFMLPYALWLAGRGHYDAVHAIEESVFMAMAARVLFRIPYVYDMDSSLPQQLAEQCPPLRFMGPVLRWFETRGIRHADCVVPMCDTLAELARERGARRVTILRDVPLVDVVPHPAGAEASLPELPDAGVRFMYVGNLEPYQGVDLMLEGFKRLLAHRRDAGLVVVGGAEGDVRRYRDTVAHQSLQDRVCFTGPVPIGLMRDLFECADVLISPRTRGVNTPMKIYSYLFSGKPVIATDIPSHTQVLDPSIAELVPLQSEAMAEAMQRLADDPDRGRRMGDRARAVAEESYSLSAFKEHAASIYAPRPGD